MYERQSRLSKGKRDRLIEHFVAGTTARAAAELVGVHRNTAASFYTRLRKVIAEQLAEASSRRPARRFAPHASRPVRSWLG